jgi:hypothetical protein
MPHPPQWVASASITTQVPPQRTYPGSHAARHCPPEQKLAPFGGVGQTWPQSPQLAESVVTSAQLPSQVLPGGLHFSAQVPFVQVGVPRLWSPRGQLVPQPPQLLRSLAILTQVPAAQGCSPGWHALLHPLPVHTCPGAQGEQLRQVDGAERSASQPLLARPSQSAYPTAHVAMAHAPPSPHVAKAFGRLQGATLGALHAFSHAGGAHTDPGSDSPAGHESLHDRGPASG